MKVPTPRMAKQPLYVHGLLCESIREEKQGTKTYVGVMDGDLEVNEVPGRLTTLAAAVWLSWPIASKPPDHIGLVVVLPDGAELVTGVVSMPPMPDAPEGATRHSVEVHLSYVNVPIATAGRLRLYAEVDGLRYVAAGLRVKLSAPASAA